MSVETRDYGDVITRWDYNKPETDWACPVCGSVRVHLNSWGDGIICFRTRNCGFAPFIGGPDRAPAAKFVRPHPAAIREIQSRQLSP